MQPDSKKSKFSCFSFGMEMTLEWLKVGVKVFFTVGVLTSSIFPLFLTLYLTKIPLENLDLWMFAVSTVNYKQKKYIKFYNHNFGFSLLFNKTFTIFIISVHFSGIVYFSQYLSRKKTSLSNNSELWQVLLLRKYLYLEVERSMLLGNNSTLMKKVRFWANKCNAKW